METIHLRIEKNGRNGKLVTLLSGFTRDPNSLELIARKMKKACGTGGRVRPNGIEIQGDLRSRIRPLLQEAGFQVKG